MRLRRSLLGLTLPLALLLSACGGSSHARASTPRLESPIPTTSTSTLTTPEVGIHKIQHVVIIMQENRSFDSYFGTYPGADGIPMQDGKPAVCIPDPPGPCVRPFHDRDDENAGGPHSENNAIADIDDGQMDGFAEQQRAGLRSCQSTFNPACGNNNGPPDVMGYHTGADIPNYWAYARDFVLQDHMFESNDSWSLPAHLYMVSEWSAHCTRKGDPSSCVNAVQSPGNPPDFQRAEGIQSPHVPDYAWTDLTYLLHKDGISWGYYVFNGSEPDCDDDAAMSCSPVPQGARTPGIWNPLPYFDTVRQDGQLGDIQSLSDFYAAARAGSLPSVSWIVPNGRVSEHPPGLVSAGQTYVTGLINAIMRSPDWDSTAIFLSWDDWGGFYDHVVPPRIDENGYGLRVPGLVISPYAKRGYIDHQVLSFDAYVKFIENDFLNGQRLDPATDGRPDPRPDVREDAPQLGDLADDFDFSQAPLAPIILPVDPQTDLIKPAPKPLSEVRSRRAALPADVIRAAARVLGMTPRQLRRELAAGESLSKIARQQGHSYNRVRAAILARLRARAGRAVR